MTETRFLDGDQLQRLIDALRGAGFRCLGPRLEDGTLQTAEITSAEQLPSGIEADLAPGTYRLRPAAHRRRFAWASAAQSLKPLTFAPREDLWQCRRDGTGRLAFEPLAPDVEPLALLGVRACDLAALALQKQHFVGSGPADPWFRQRLEALFIVAVNCSHAADTCFCASTGDGPAAESGFDLALHELDHGYLVDAGSERGEKILGRLALRAADGAELGAARAELDACAASQQRRLPDGHETLLMERLEHPRWAEVGGRCLSCGNCTAMCPSCFCHQQRDEADIAADSAAHFRQWSSCFTHNHGYLAGHQLRPTPAKRYRQWLTHKFATWHDQYGRSGCVGCGRCIAWCPVGIDVTEELRALCSEASDG